MGKNATSWFLLNLPLEIISIIMKNWKINTKRVFNLFTIALLVTFFSGCNKDKTEIIEDLSVDENGFTVIRTNNYAYCNYSLNIPTADLSSFMSDSIQTDLLKVSGYSGAYYGIYFNGSLNTTNDMDNFCAVLINTKGYYIIIKRVSGSYSALDETGAWVVPTYVSPLDEFASLNLIQGYNQLNTIKVKVVAANSYKLYLNGILTHSFNETELTTGLKKGFMFDIGSQEDEGLPDNFVEIKFKEIKAS